MARKQKIRVGSDGELLTPFETEKEKNRPPNFSFCLLVVLLVFLLVASMATLVLLVERDTGEAQQVIQPTADENPTDTLPIFTRQPVTLPPVWTSTPTRTPFPTRTPTSTSTPLPSPTATPTSTPTPETRSWEVDVDARLGWQDTGINVQAGEMLEISYQAGQWRNRSDIDLLAPNGGITEICDHIGCREPLRAFPQGGMVGQIGEGAVFSVGDYTRLYIDTGGRLRLRINDLDEGLWDNTGNVLMQVQLYRPNLLTSPAELEVEVYGAYEWQSTTLWIQPGDLLEIEYLEGFWQVVPQGVDADSSGVGTYTCLVECVELMDNYPRGGLVGKIGESDLFAVGTRRTIRAQEEGILAFRINDTIIGDNSGAVRIRITVQKEGR